MARYIDAEKINLPEGFFNTVDNVPKFYEWVETLPTADVRENVHGKWLMSDESKLRPYMCSRCGSLYDVDTVMGKIVWNYCPNCGAVMDESEEPTMEEYMYGQEGSEEDGSL